MKLTCGLYDTLGGFKGHWNTSLGYYTWVYGFLDHHVKICKNKNWHNKDTTFEFLQATKTTTVRKTKTFLANQKVSQSQKGVVRSPLDDLCIDIWMSVMCDVSVPRWQKDRVQQCTISKVYSLSSLSLPPRWPGDVSNINNNKDNKERNHTVSSWLNVGSLKFAVCSFLPKFSAIGAHYRLPSTQVSSTYISKITFIFPKQHLFFKRKIHFSKTIFYFSKATFIFPKQHIFFQRNIYISII